MQMAAIRSRAETELWPKPQQHTTSQPIERQERKIIAKPEPDFMLFLCRTEQNEADAEQCAGGTHTTPHTHRHTQFLFIHGHTGLYVSAHQGTARITQLGVQFNKKNVYIFICVYHNKMRQF